MKIFVCLGTGGVGKTSISASLALHSALQGDRTLVLTIDPARRLKTALAIQHSEQQRVDLSSLTTNPRGELWAAAVDVETILNRAVKLYARDQDAPRILGHPIYKALLSALAGMEELLAIERLDQAIADGFETIVVDTAPSRHSLEFLDKPEFFVQLVSFPLVRLIARTFHLWERTPFFRLGRKTFEVYSNVESLLGSTLVRQILDFFSVFLPVAEGYAKRARRTAGRLRDPATTTFCLVTTPFKAARDGPYFLAQLHKRRFPTGMLLVNRCWPGFQKPSGIDGTLFEETFAWYESIVAAQKAAWDETVEDLQKRVPILLRLPELDVDIDGLRPLSKLARCFSDAGISSHESE